MSGTSHLKVLLILGGLLAVTSPQSRAQDGSLIGPVKAEEILRQDRIFEIYVQRYEPDEEALNFLNSVEDSVHLKIFFGTWCKDSKKYIPGLIKTLQQLSTPLIQADYIGVDRQKKFPPEFLKMFDIKYIPTVVVLKGNIEAGRLEDIPKDRIETELVHILKGVQMKKNNR